VFLLNPDVLQITAADLEALIENEVIESQHIEYKRTIAAGKADEKASDKLKLLASISSFANTDGGDLLIGIRAENGFPKELTGIPRDELDTLKLGIEQAMQTGIEPRIGVYSVHPVNITDSLSVLIVRIHRSWMQPHRVIAAQHDKFYGRHSSGKFPMNVDQLRIAFTLSVTWEERAKQLQQELVATVLRQETVQHCPAPWIVMHLIPYDSVGPLRALNVDGAAKLGNLAMLPPGHMNCSQRFNLNGLLAWAGVEDGKGRSCISGYVQLFRNGIVEAVDASMGRLLAGPEPSVKVIGALHLEVELLKAVRRYMALLRAMGVAPPIIIMVSLLGVKDYTLGASHLQGFRMVRSVFPFDRDTIVLPSVKADSYDVDRAVLMRPIFDTLWNAAGWSRCPDYSETGDLNIDQSWFADEQ